VVSAFGFNPNDPGSTPGRSFLKKIFLFLTFIIFDDIK
jgi:hypothetical protein